MLEKIYGRKINTAISLPFNLHCKSNICLSLFRIVVLFEDITRIKSKAAISLPFNLHCKRIATLFFKFHILSSCLRIAEIMNLDLIFKKSQVDSMI